MTLSLGNRFCTGKCKNAASPRSKKGETHGAR